MIDNSVPVDGLATSSTLLSGVRAHDPEAWRRFMALYRPLILYWCQRSNLQVADAEDVTQEVFGAAAGAIDSFRHDRPEDTLRGWLRTITRNKVRDHLRMAARRTPATGGSDAHGELLAVPEPSAEPDDEAHATEKQIVLRQAFELVLSGFKDQTRQAFWRVVIDGQRPEDVAAELGVQVHSVYLAKSRVLRRLQDEFGGLVNWDTKAGPSLEPPKNTI